MQRRRQTQQDNHTRPRNGLVSCFSTIKSRSNHFIILFIFLAGTVASLFSAIVPSLAVYADACTKAQLQQTNTAYTAEYGTGVIRALTTGYYGTAASGRTAASCTSYGKGDLETYTRTSSGSLKYQSDNTSCTNSSTGGTASTVYGTITISSAIANKTADIQGSLTGVSGSGGKGDPCKPTAAKSVTITVTASSSTSASCTSTTYQMVYSSATISGRECKSGALSLTQYLQVVGDSLSFSTLPPPTGQAGTGPCTGQAYATITLKNAPKAGDTTVNASVQALKEGYLGKGKCVNYGDPQSISIDILTIACDAGDYTSVCVSYASIICHNRGLDIGSAATYSACLTAQSTIFQGFYTACNTAGTSPAKVLDCLEGKAPEVKDLLEALRGKEVAPASSCAINGIGWIVCPVVNFLASIADGAFGFLANNFLKTDTKLVDTSSTNGTYTAWTYMRNIANVAFVIAFLIIIFSQITGAGVSNYGVKKLLPRIVLAAILVNVSFFISQIAVDISNILGFSIKDAFNGITHSVDKASSVSVALQDANNPIGNASTGTGFAGVAGTVLAVAIVGVAGYAMLSTLIPIILAAVVALIMILFILVARQAIIVLLIVVSPLAFVAFLLPNTQGLFTQWRKMFTSMLLLFPIIALVFGASTLASHILSTAFSGSNGISGDTNNVFGQIIAAGILVLPLFAVPVILKKSLEGIPALGQMASKFAGRANGNLGKKIGESNKGSLAARGLAYRKAGMESYRSKKFAERVAKGGAAGRIAGGLAVTPAGRAGQESLVKSAVATSLKAENEDIEAAKGVMVNSNMSGAQRHELATKGSVSVNGKTYSGKTMQKAAIQEVFRAGSYGEQESILQGVARKASGDPGDLHEFRQAIASGVASNGLGSRDPALSGKRIDEISQGTFNYNNAVKQAAAEGKYTPEALASMNDDARANAIRVANDNAAAGDGSTLLALRRGAAGITAEMRGKMSTSTDAVSHLKQLS